ncbi:MAG: type II secretion system F family protein [Candidatus Sericytochromatia bacterium]|nr:type II secretion system F family protein [Candidatus Sericytochromatia bacterium]
MWLAACLTFLGVAAVVWLLLDRGPVTVTTEGPRHLQRGDRGLDHLLDRLQIPLHAKEALALMGLTGTSVALAISVWLQDATVGVAAGLALPLVAAAALRKRLTANQLALNEQLPDALVMMINSLKAGHTLSHAFQNLGEDLSAPLGPESRRLDRALQMGQSPETALQDMRRRLATVEIDMLVQAMLIQRETGGNLAELLGNIQGTVRERMKLKGKVQSLTAQGKLSGLVIGLLPFGLFFFLWTGNRSYLMPFLLHPVGQQVMAAALLAQICGYLTIRRIVNFPI